MRTNLPKLEKRHDRYLGNSRLVELGERINRHHRYGAVTKDPAIPSVIEDVFEKARHYQVGVDSTGTPVIATTSSTIITMTRVGGHWHGSRPPN